MNLIVGGWANFPYWPGWYPGVHSTADIYGIHRSDGSGHDGVPPDSAIDYLTVNDGFDEGNTDEDGGHEEVTSVTSQFWV